MPDSAVEFFDQFVDNFYEEINPKDIKLREGQLAWAPVSFFQIHKKVWRPDHIEEDEWGFANADYFSVVNEPADIFTHGVPIKSPEERKSTEEFLFTRAKFRPVVILFISDYLESVQESRYGHKLKHDVVAATPLYSIFSKNSNKARFKEKTVQKARYLKYHNLFFLPEHRTFEIRDSLVRTDHVFSIYPELLKPIPLKLSVESYTILKQLLEALLNKNVRDGSDLAAYIEMYNEIKF